jgi:hypothetical protein
MSLAMFVGFNNQLQNVVFTQPLIRDEHTNTFEWVLQQFKNYMVNKIADCNIHADQDG